MRRNLQGLRMLITGASSGIGRALALLAAMEGVRLLLTARRHDRLEELAAEIQAQGGEAHYVAGDITDPQLRQQLIETAQNLWGGLDILVNNAGVGARGPFETASAERLRTLMEVNFFAPVELTRAALPLLAQGTTPAICNISSVLAHRAVPTRSEYSASKFALHGFSDALRAELSKKGIDVVLVSPSTISSEFSEAAIEKEGHDPSMRQFARTPQQVARATLAAIQAGKHEVIPSYTGQLLVGVDRLCPRLANWLVAKFSRF